MSARGPRRGDLVEVRFRKYDETPHWAIDAVHLGADDHGAWVGFVQGTRVSRPGMALDLVQDQVGLFADLGPLVGSASTFHAPEPPPHVEVYVDLTTPAEWARCRRGWRVSLIDLDLDVIRGTTGRVWVDDEHEFAAHRQSMGYPEDLATGAVDACRRIEERVRARTPPYDHATAAGWLASLRALS